MSFDNVAIRVKNLGKCYDIYNSPRDRLKQFILPPIRRVAGLSTRQYFKEFWALKDITFEVKRGDTVGIIGRNGSGKSTLLQIICGTLNPTLGTVEAKGRIAALLELGAGFNPEFSGRENVFMNAALLGLTHDQIQLRFDKIAAFADIGEHLEQPVKTYSSGMYVRLAFAVMAHVDAEILVIDEALAVGDAVFTQKCMRFIRAFQENGTLLFVSHDIGSVQTLCRTAIWLGHGRVVKSGPSLEVAQAYLQYTLQEVYGDAIKLKEIDEDTRVGNQQVSASAGIIDVSEGAPVVDYGAIFTGEQNLKEAKGWKTGAAEIFNVNVENLDLNSIQGVFKGWDPVRMTIRARAHQDMLNPILGFLVRDRLGQDLFGENTLQFSASKSCPVKAGQEFVAHFDFRLPMLPNGQYLVMASAADGDLYNNVQHHWLHDAYIFTVSSSAIRWGLVGVPFERISLEIL